MITVTAEVKNNALVLPADTIVQLGWREDAKVLIEKQNSTVVLRPQQLTAEEIADLACTYLVEYVGDATAVKTPVWTNGKWRVEVVLSYRPETIGYLTFSQFGELIEEESDSREKLKGLAE
jgi:antitoxin component of MazEF toxin-antitoxin module